MTSYWKPNNSRRGWFQAKFSLTEVGVSNQGRPTLSSFVDLSHTRRVLASGSRKPVNPSSIRAERFLDEKARRKKIPLSLAPSGKKPATSP